MPIDFDPAPDGNIRLVNGEAVVAKGGNDAQATLEGMVDGDTFVSHFATCPYAARHRKRED